MPFAWVGAATSILGAVNGAEGQQESTTKQNELDPRMQGLVYGKDPNTIGGLLGDATNWYQANKSGMNDQMRQGLNQQWQTFSDPATMAGYRQMSNLGSGLLGAPVMGNPFSDGRVSLMSGRGGLGQGTPNLGFGGGATFGGSPPTQGQYPSYQPVYGGAQPPATANSGPFAAPPPPPAAPPAAPPGPIPQYPGMSYVEPERYYMTPEGNMYVSRNGQAPVSLYAQDFGTGNGGA